MVQPNTLLFLITVRKFTKWWSILKSLFTNHPSRNPNLIITNTSYVQSLTLIILAQNFASTNSINDPTFNCNQSAIRCSHLHRFNESRETQSHLIIQLQNINVRLAFNREQIPN